MEVPVLTGKKYCIRRIKMQKKQKENARISNSRRIKNSPGRLLLVAVIITAIIGLTGCPTEPGENGGGLNKAAFPPEKPFFVGSQTGFELLLSDLKNTADADSEDPAKLGAVVAFTWSGEGALEYDVYFDTESVRPLTPQATGIRENVYFARNLNEETDYYFWVEAKNENGSTFSDPLVKTTGKKGPQAGGGIERGDYPRNMKVVPGNGSLTVTWNLPDRVGWQEVYYAPVGTIKHADAYKSIRFKWDEAPFTSTTAYKDTTMQGYTGLLYPFESPLVAGSWRGYYIGLNSGTDGDTRPIMGTNDFGNAKYPDYPQAGAFPFIFEGWKEGDGPNDLGRLQPYKKLHSSFANAIPWDAANNKAGTPGTPIKHFSNSATITGLNNGTEYEVWVRCPNANGERGYGYVVGTPGAGDALPAPSRVNVYTQPDATRNLIVSWNKVIGAERYRIYASKFSYTPNATMSYAAISATANPVHTLVGLAAGTTYYIWVVAEKGGLPGTFGKPVIAVTPSAPASGHTGDKLIAGTSQRVKTAVYVEVNDNNPLNAGSYILEDGTYLFDYVIIFAANIRNRNCAAEGGAHGCTNTGTVHLHLNENVRYILENRQKYIVPLQQKGIKVLLGLLGDHDGIGFASMGDADREAFVASVKAGLELYQLDGVDFDDEWASKEAWDKVVPANNPTPESIWTYPQSVWSWPLSLTVYRDPTKGIVPGNGIKTAPSNDDMAKMWAESGDTYYKTILAMRAALPRPKYTVSLYEYNTGRYITAGTDGKNPTTGSTATMEGLRDAIDFSMQPWYNQYIANSANSLPRSIYSPFGMDVGGYAYSSQNGAPNPPIVASSTGAETATNTIHDFSTRFKTAAAEDNAYNFLYFYGLNESSKLLKRYSSESAFTVTKEAYLSRMSNIVFGQDVVLTAEGGDYRKDW